MMKILTVIGARPQIIKSAALSRAIKNKFPDQLKEVLVHTGQHYDSNMSQVFFDELQLSKPDYQLTIGSDIREKQIALMAEEIEEIVLKELPEMIVVYGDTNSTLAGAMVASKLKIPLSHIEAGLRSYNKLMPEEENRVKCDHASTLLFSPTKTGYSNLLKEGFKENNEPPYSANNPKIMHCGDVMYDNSLFFAKTAEEKTDILEQYKLESGNFIVATIHRNTNTDDPKRLINIFNTLKKLSEDKRVKIIIPLHPRTSKMLMEHLPQEGYLSLMTSACLKIIEPVSFLEMIMLEKKSQLVMTDSGGVQKEAFFFKKPCIILRAETEWVELVECGSAIIADADEERMVKAYDHFENKKNLQFPSIFGDGNAAEFICNEILKFKS